MTLPRIVVDKPVVVGSTVTYNLRPDRALRSYFSSERMFATYEVRLADVPQPILLIPFVATLAPIAWALGAELRLPSVDRVFLESLLEVREALRELHPAVSWDGDIRADTIVDGDEASYEHEALLFSGGVDSLASFVTHRHGKPLLVAVWGADVGVGKTDVWDRVMAAHRRFASGQRLDIVSVKSNFRTFFSHYKLRARFFRNFANWYSAAQQGLGLTGLCAPLSYVYELKRVRIASGATDQSAGPWGSRPSIDNAVRWGSTQVIHDGFSLTRQAKLAVIAQYIRDEDPRLQLRVCLGRSGNCSRCVKCSLTMVGLTLEGIDANHHGFRVDAATMADIRDQLEQGAMHLSDLAVWHWTEIQHRIPTRAPLHLDGIENFLGWLQGVSIRDCQVAFRARTQRPRAALQRYVTSFPEPVGRWIRRYLGRPFP